MKKSLWIDTKTGFSADRFAAALIGLGMPEQIMVQTIKCAAEDLVMLDAHTHLEFLPNETLAHRLHLTPLEEQEPLPWEETPAVLKKTLSRAGCCQNHGCLSFSRTNRLLAHHRHGTHTIQTQSPFPTPT